MGPPALRPRAAARHGVCVAGLGRPPLPLTSGARWLVEGIREGDLFFFFSDFVVNSGCSLRNLYKIKEKCENYEIDFVRFVRSRSTK